MAGFIEFIRFSKYRYAGPSTSFGKQQTDAQPMIEHLAPFAMHFLLGGRIIERARTWHQHASPPANTKPYETAASISAKNHLVDLNFYRNRMAAIFDKPISKIGEKVPALFFNLYQPIVLCARST